MCKERYAYTKIRISAVAMVLVIALNQCESANHVQLSSCGIFINIILMKFFKRSSSFVPIEISRGLV